MITHIFHGDDPAASRTALLEFLNTYQQATHRLQKIDLSTVSENFHLADLGGEGLFGEIPLLVIENLHAGQKSKKQAALIQAVNDLPSETILWEKKTLTKLMLAQFPSAQVQVFNARNPLWELLASFSPDPKHLPKTITLFRAALATGQDSYYLLAMIAWQIRQLIGAAEGYYAGMPAKKATTLKRAEDFGLARLLKLHRQLLEVDHGAKTSQLSLPLEKELEYFFANATN